MNDHCLKTKPYKTAWGRSDNSEKQKKSHQSTIKEKSNSTISKKQNNFLVNIITC